MTPEAFHLNFLFWFSLGFLSVAYMISKGLLPVLSLRRKSKLLPDSDLKTPLADLARRIDMAENARKWYQNCVNNNPDFVPDALEIMLHHSMQAAARFAVQEARDGKVSLRPRVQTSRIESLLESCWLALTENGVREEDAETRIKDGITFILHSFEMSDSRMPARIISNPAENYFEVRHNRF